MRKMFLILLLTSPCLASGPKYNFSDSKLVDEFVNVYKDIGNVLKGNVRISSATITTLTVGTITSTGTIGKIVQIVNGTTNGSTSTTSTSFVNTGLTVTITPRSASDNILIIVASNYFDNTGVFFACVTLNSSVGGDLGSGAGSVGYACTVAAGTNQNNANASFIVSEAPATTSAVTYTIQIKTTNAAGTARSNTSTGKQFISAIEYVP